METETNDTQISPKELLQIYDIVYDIDLRSYLRASGSNHTINYLPKTLHCPDEMRTSLKAPHVLRGDLIEPS